MRVAAVNIAAMVVTPRLVALALAGLAACTPICDDERLRRAVAMLAAGRRDPALVALGEACPTLPPALAEGLRAGESSAAAAADPAWLALLARVCPEATHAEGATAVTRELDGARVLCDLDRYGLLPAGAVFSRDDLFVHALFDWLLAQRVDRELAGSLAAPLLTAHDYAAAGLTPPRGSTGTPLRGAESRVRITAGALMVDGVLVHPLDQGRPAPGAFERHVSRDLVAALEPAATRAKQRAEATGRPWTGMLTIDADRSTPYATLADVVHTGLAAEYSEYELVVHDGVELHGQFVAPALMWLPVPLEQTGHVRAHDLGLTFIVGTTAVEARTRGQQGEGTRFDMPAGAAIAEHVRKLKSLFPSEVVATFRVADDVPLQALVSLLDTVAGAGCDLGPALRGEPVPDECLFWQPILDHEPPYTHPVHTRP